MSLADQKLLEKLRNAVMVIQKLEEDNRALQRARSEPIAIVGMGCRFPGAADVRHFWKLLQEGKDAIQEVPRSRWDLADFFDPNPETAGKMYSRSGGFVDDIDQFDAAFFGISPREATAMDPQHRLVLETAWQALENAGQAPAQLLGSKTGVFLGISSSDYAWLTAAEGPESLDAYYGVGSALSAAAGRLAYSLGLHGPAVSIDTACSSALVAVHQACRSLAEGECTLALAGGVNLILNPLINVTLCRARMLAADGRCKTFDAAADGYVRGEGCGLIVLRRLSDAQAAGDRILAVIRGSAVNQDGRSGGLTVPNGPAQEAVIREALAWGGIEPQDVNYIEAHGTGTSLGDPIEVQALAAALGQGRSKEQPLLIGSVKTNIGHLEAAAGIAGLIKVVLALQAEEIPAHLHYTNPNPRIPWSELPIQVTSERTPWQRGARPRIAGISSFGFIGTNAHVVVEEPPPPAPPTSSSQRPLHLLTLSARSESALRDLAGRYLSEPADVSLADICYTANVGRSHLPHRLALLAENVEELRRKLQAAIGNEEAEGLFRRQVSKARPKVAFLLPGKESWFPGLGSALLDSEPAFRQAIQRCQELMGAYLSRSLGELFEADASLTSRERDAAVFALEYGMARLVQGWGIAPDAVLGRGVGEVVAACLAGILSLEDSIRLLLNPSASDVTFSPPRIPWFSTRADRPIADVPDPASWQARLQAPERIDETFHALAEEAPSFLLEVGAASSWKAEQDIAADRPHANGHASRPPAAILPTLGHDGKSWRTLLSSLAQLHVAGVAVDWPSFHRGQPGRKVELPTYPFERERYWTASAAGVRSTTGPSHPLLGVQHVSASGEIVYAGELGLARLPFLADHRVHNVLAVAGSTYAAMALAACGVPGRIRELIFLQPMLLEDDEAKSFQFVLAPPTQDGSRPFGVYSRSEDEPARGWTRHAAGTWEPIADRNGSDTSISIDSLREGMQPWDPAASPVPLLPEGLEFGPSYRARGSMWVREGEAFGELTMPANVEGGDIPLHPAVLDACTQVIYAARGPMNSERELFAPMEYRLLSWYGPAPTKLFVHARMRTPPGGTVQTYDVKILNGAGQLLGEIQGLTLRRAPREAFLRGKRADAAPPAPVDGRIVGVTGALAVKLQSALPGDRPELLVEHVLQQTASVLGMRAGQVPDRQTSLFELGLDSLMAVELRNRLQNDLGGTELSSTVVFDHPTAEGLATHIAEKLKVVEAAAPVRQQRRVATDEPIAIVGMACRFPGGEDIDAFWRLLHEGREALREFPPERWDLQSFYDPDPEAPGKMYVRRAALLEEIDRFDPSFFGIAPREVASMDPQQRMLLEVAWEALESAGIPTDRLSGQRVGVYLGIMGSDFASLLGGQGSEAIDLYVGTGTAPAAAAGRVSYLLGLQGPCVALDTGCSSSLVAISLACDALRSGRCEAALAAGVNAILTPEPVVGRCKMRLLAPDSRCKTFDAAANGFVGGEGCGVLVLKRLSDAQRDGDRIFALVRGTGVNQDGRGGGLTVPNGAAQQAVIREALAFAGLEPWDLQYVEAHGTGTSLGDPIEVQALAAALGEGRSQEDPLLIGSVKTNVGHLEGAAGVAGVIKVVLALQNEEIPPHLHFNTPNPHIPWAALPVKVTARPVPWPRGGRRRLAGVSSFGLSGTNAHVVLEEAPLPPTPSPVVDRPAEVLTLSARSEPALRELAERYARYLTSTSAPFGDVCHTANAGRAHFRHRLALVAGTAEEARHKLNAAAAGQPVEGSYRGQLTGKGRLKIAFLFTGQGSQYADMGRALFETQPTFRKLLLSCEEILARQSWGERGQTRKLTEVLFQEPDLLERTEYAQPALFALEYSLAKLWQAWGVTPDVVVGHSVGEYVAACLAGVFSLEDGLRLITERGRLMGELPAGGAMAAVLADVPRVSSVLERFAGRVGIAAMNGPTQTVISGEAEAVEAVRNLLAEQGVRSVPLHVSHAFHSHLLEPMLGEFARVCGTVSYARPRLGLVSNLHGRLLRPDETPDASYWIDHARQPVRFAEGMQAALAHGCAVLLEVGPHPVLSALLPSPVADAYAFVALPTLQRGADDWSILLDTLAQLEVTGVSVDWDAFDRDYPRRKVALPSYPFQRQQFPLPARSQRAGKNGFHPLLGPVTPSAVHGDYTFQTILGIREVPWLGHHRVFGEIVFPGTGYLETALSSCRQALANNGAALEQVEFREPLVLSEDATCTLQTVVIPGEPGTAEWRIYSRLAQAQAEPRPWALHAQGRARVAGPESPAVPTVAELLARCPELLPVDRFYEGIASRGVDFGSSFMNVAELRRGQGEAVGQIQMPEELQSQRGYAFHPALLDACLQVCGGISVHEEDGSTHMPWGVERLQVQETPVGSLWCWARLRADSTPDAPTFDLHVFQESGSLIATVTGLSLRRIEHARLRKSRQEVGRWLYEVEWELQATTGAATAASFVGPAAVAGQLQAHATQQIRILVDRFPGLQQEIETLGAEYVIAAMHRLSIPWNPGETLAAATLRPIAKQERLAGRLLAMLAEEALLEPCAEGWRILQPLPTVDPQQRLERLRQVFPGADIEITLLARCGEQLAEVLRGRCDPLPLLFPSSGASAESLYKDSPGSKAFNQMVGDAVAHAMKTWPADRRLRVLEIGAGTGGTTHAVLPRLPVEHTSYTFTDISAAFLAPARQKFASYPFVEFRTLDIERDPTTQGFAEHGYDLILAANVLHATADLKRCVEHVRQLLAPSGLLVLLEGTRPQRSVDLTFGLLEGWWKFTDRELRPGHPLLSVEAWQALLSAVGFVESAYLPEAEQERIGEAVILARGPGAAVASRTSRLVLDDGSDVAAALAATSGATLIESSSTDWLAQAHAWLQQTASTPDTRDVIYLNAQQDSNPVESCVRVLELVQAMVTHGGNRPPRLLLVTRGAQPVMATDRCEGVMQSVLWGLGRSIAHEHPEFHCRLLDLEPGESATVSAQQVLDVLDGSNAEAQVAVRGQRGYVARLTASPGTRLPMLPGPCRLRIPQRGSPDQLALTPLERRQPGPGEVEIEVHAAGLNFLDVLDVLGVLPFHRPELGGECAGRVVAVGPDVQDLAIGDEVFALSIGSLGTHVTTLASMVVKKPANLSFSEAGTIPGTFLTAELGLNRMASMKAGMKVLIHAAAGGVGLAAVQLAKEAGAEIYATASPGKQAFLRSLGIKHIFNSRTLDFAEQILECTNGEGVDLVLNSLTSGDFIPKSLSVLRPGGWFLEMSKRSIWTAEQAAAVRPDVHYGIVALERMVFETPAAVGDMLRDLVGRLEAGKLQPLLLTEFSLTEAPEAFRFMQQARHVGKIVLRVPHTLKTLLRPDATYLIIGGLGGVGLLTAQHLVREGARHLVLMSRGTPNEWAAKCITEMQEAGAEVITVQGDVSRAEDVERVFQHVEACLPPLRGVIHSAVVLNDGVLVNQTRERFVSVLAPKVLGAMHLDARTRRVPLDFFLLYSSIGSLLGPAGQANYAAANTYLDTLARWRSIRGLPTISINWGAWSEVGAAARTGVVEKAAEYGLGVIDPPAGLEALDRVVAQGASQVAVAPTDWRRLFQASSVPPFFSRLAAPKQPSATSRQPAPGSGALMARIREAAPAKRQEVLVDHVQKQVAKVLGLDGQALDRRTGFFDLGMDSLMAVELRNRLQSDLGGTQLSATAVFDHPNVEALATHLGEKLSTVAAAAPVVSVPRSTTEEPIAIVGLSCRFPGAETPEAFWQLLREGREGVREISSDRWDVDAYYDPDPEARGKMYVRRAALLNRIDQFDAGFFGISPREAVSLDPQQRLLLETAWEALENAGLAVDRFVGGQVGVYVGISGSDYAVSLFQRGGENIDPYLGTGTSVAVAAGRLSYVLGFQGPAVSIDTACSSSLVAVSQACAALRAGHCTLALAGGVNALVNPEPTIAECKARMLAPDGRCKTFDAAADGFVRGEGCGVIVLKRLSEAQRDGDRILALIRGSAINQDGRSSGLTVPNGPAQQAVVRAALADAGIAPAEVNYVEAHGTGTSLGDPIEVQALGESLGSGRSQDRPLLIGSVKTNIGHLEAAAGIAGLIKVVLALQNEEIPRHLHFNTPNPHIAWNSLPVQVTSKPVAWPRGSARRIAGVSSFGFSGTNAHVLLEEAPPAAIPASTADRPVHLLALSARSSTALHELAERYQSHVDPLPDVCFTANAGRVHFAERLALVAATPDEARQQLAAAVTGNECPGLYRGVSSSKQRPRVAFLFTGQGAQYAGMSRQLFETQPTFRKALLQCEEILRPCLEQPLTAMLFGDSACLDRTEVTQPALFAVEYALATLWQSWGIHPDVVLGHSVGEYAAACVASVFSLEDGLKLIAERARLMGALPAGGAMAVILASAEQIEEPLKSYAGRLTIAALNGPANTVVSGDGNALAEFRQRLEPQGIRSVPLPVSHAFHSHLLEPMLDTFARSAAGVRYASPAIPLISNLTGRLLERAPDVSYWREHARQPVRFAEGTATLMAQGCGVILEVGPQPVLIGMARQCTPEAGGTYLPSLRRGADDWRTLLGSVAELYLRGASIDWAAFDRDYARRRVAVPTYPFQRSRYWLDTSRRVRSGSDASHPLLGPGTRSAVHGDLTFETALSPHEPSWLGEHRIGGTAVFPGTAYLEAATAAAQKALGCTEVMLEDAEFRTVLVLPDKGTRTIQTVVTTDATDPCRWSLYSFDDSSSWTLHAQGRARVATPMSDHHALAERRARCSESISVDALYGNCAASGLDYGPAFRGLVELIHGTGEALGRIQLPEELHDRDRYRFHPALLDACLQVCGGTMASNGDTAAFLPVGVERFQLRDTQQTSFWCFARVRPDSEPQAPAFDLDVHEESGRVIAVVTGLRLRQVERGKSDTANCFYEVAWERFVIRAASPAGAGRWLVFADHGGLGAALAGARASSIVVESAENYERCSPHHYRLNPDRPSDFEQLLADAGAVAEVVYLWSLDAVAGSDVCAGVLHLIQALARSGTGQGRRLLFATRGAQAVLPDDSVEGCWQAPLWGMGRSMPLEHPDLPCRFIDLDGGRRELAVAQLGAELALPRGEDLEDQVAYRGEQRYVARLVRKHVPARHALPLSSEATYLITGGLGGLGLVTAQWLVERGARYVVLMGRGAPRPEAEEVIRRMENAGATVHVKLGDVASAADVRRVLDEIAGALLPLRGVIHSAGVLDDGILLNQTAERFAKVLAPKVVGGWNLHEGTRDLPLDFFVLYSSGAALLPLAGQANHSAANRFLDALAHRRRAEGKPALTINWGVWSEVGAAEHRGVPDMARTRGFRPIDPAFGRAAFEQLLGSEVTQVAVLPVDWSRMRGLSVPPFLSRLISAGHPRGAGAAADQLASRLKSATPAERGNLLVDFVEQEATRVLGLGSGNASVRKNSFFELGMDSLMAIDLRNRLQSGLGVTLPPTLVFEHPTIEALAAQLQKGQFAAPASPLVPMQPNGSRPPFFCVHPAIGLLVGLSPLVHHLGAEQPFFGLEPRGLREGEVPLQRVEQMAALYVEAIAQAQPSGPLYIGGWSAGGNIAFEMVRRLQRAGRHVALLTLLDTSAYYVGDSVGDEAMKEQTLQAMLQFFGGESEVDHTLSAEERLSRLLQGGSKPQGDAYHPERIFEVLRATGDAVKTYEPQPCSVRTVLFRAAEKPEWAPPEADLGWSRWIQGPLEVIEVPGNHYTMARVPHVAVLAEQLQRQLAAVRAGLDG